jgi:uncharacterized protein DUF1203
MSETGEHGARTRVTMTVPSFRCSPMPSFQLVGLPAEQFEPFFELVDSNLAALGAKRVVASEHPGYPCRISLLDAEIGEELLLLSYAHHRVASPYQASGPIFVRRGAKQRILQVGEVPDYVRRRLISARAYDSAQMMVSAEVCEGTDVGSRIERLLLDERVEYVHLHNAKQGCFSCLVARA